MAVRVVVVVRGCARGGGGWEDGRCCGYWHIFGFHICHPNLYHFLLLHHCIGVLMMFYNP